MKKFILFTVAALFVFQAKATHIVGGSMFYEHLGGSSYLVSVRLYKDCSPFSINFSSSLLVEIRQGNGTSPTPSSVRLPLLARDTLDPTVDTCAFNPGVCVELGVYSKIVNLPPQVGGYHLFYTDCCRNASVVNIVSPLTHGAALHTYVPDNNILITNSSPVFTSYPPVYVCQGEDLNFDFSATDADGDSLTYQLITPYHGKNEFDPAYTGLLPVISSTGTIPDNITFNTIAYLPGYSATNPLNPISGNGLTLSSTGLLTGIPQLTGQFLVAVRVDEYRNGVKIGTVVRDFQYNVLICPPLKDAGIGQPEVCNGPTVTMVNESGAGANGFWWDFGTGNPGDTSVLETPTFSFPGIGSYNLTLIAQKGTLCADTATLEIKLSNILADNTLADTLCIDEVVAFQSNSFASSNDSIVSTVWNFGNSQLDTGTVVSYGYPAMGDYSVEMIAQTENGCMDTVVKPIYIKVPPEADFSPTTICNTQNVQFVNESSTGASGFWWSYGTGNPGDTSVLNTPTFSFPTFGAYPVTLITQKGTACADTVVKSVSLYDVVADFDMPDTICKNSIINFQDLTTVNGTTITGWQWVLGNGNTSNLQNPIQNYTTTGVYPVQLAITTASGCTDTIIKNLTVLDIPTVQFAPNDLCSGLSVSFTNQSNAAATSFLWDFGTGQVSDQSSAVNPTFTFPVFGTYNVTLTANPGTSCEEMTNLQINVSNVQADFNVQDTTCQSSIISFTDQSSASSTLIQWHWNFDDLTTSLSQNNFHQFNASGTYNVTLTAYASDGCSDTITKAVEVLAAPIISGGNDTTLCAGEQSITITGIAQNSSAVLWEGNGGSFMPDMTSTTVTYSPNSTEFNDGVTFVVFSSAQNPFCPIVTDTVLIDFIELPEVATVDDFSVCENTQFVPIGGTIVNTSQIEWSSLGTGTFVNQNILSTSYSPSLADLSNGSVALVLSSVNAFGCDNDSDTLIVTFTAIPTANIEFSDTVCFFGTVDLVSNSNTGNGYWTTIGDGFFTPSDTGATTTYNTGLIDSDLGYANLVFHSLDNNGCAQLIDSIRITILPIVEPDLGTILSCVGSPTELTDLTNYQEPMAAWEWVIGDSTYTTSNPQHQFPDTGHFDVTLTVTSVSGCQGSAVIPIKVQSLPIADFIAPEPCIYGAVFIDSSFADSTDIVSWLWYFGDGDSSTVQNPTHLYDTLGDYDVTLQVQSGFGCVNDVTYTVPIYPPPVAQFTYFPNPAQVGEEIAFSSIAFSVNAPIVIWDWDFGNGDSSALVDPITSYDLGGIYQIEQIVFDAVGCRDTAVETIFISHGPKVPSAFSPNGDGVNDYLMILGSGFEEIDFTIYNNWGRVLFNTTDVNDQGWDGKYNDEPQPLGVYVYKARVKTVYGQEIEISGDVTIIK